MYNFNFYNPTRILFGKERLDNLNQLMPGIGVPQNWSIHMIEQELTSLYGIDHALTLAIIAPSLYEVRREKKQAKLIQYAERV